MLDLPLDPPFVLLEDRLGPEPGGRLYTRPAREIRCDRGDQVEPALAALAEAVEAGLFAAGYIGFEAWGALEPRVGRALAARSPLPPAEVVEPILWFGLFEREQEVSGEDLDAMFAAAPPGAVRDLAPAHDRTDHVGRVEAALRLIQAGDIYQVNLTFPIAFRHDGAPAGLYAALRAAQPVRHGALVAHRDWTVLSISPERFVRTRAGQAEVRPMKGTTARRSDPTEDAAAAAELALDPKQRAENLMIVDLLRNDLSRVCRPGTVRTPQLWTVERYPTFHALTSTVVGELSDGVGAVPVIEALFPCGSVVGAPKIRAGEIIGALEDGPRGVYTGAIGAIAPGGELDFNVAIRTAVLTPDGAGRFSVGGGIVADSDPSAEYDEALLKARVLTDLAQDFHLIETLRWSPPQGRDQGRDRGPDRGFVRLDAHLRRLTTSAATLGFALDLAALDERLGAAAATWRADGARDLRVRIALHRDGRIEIAHTPLDPTPDSPARVGLFDGGLDPGDPLLRHKTSRRTVYEAAARAAKASGLDEMLILNRRGEIADAARHSVFMGPTDRLVTPRLADGALAGVLRGVLIEAGRAVEGRLRPDALQGPLHIGNSLRGLRLAILV